MILRARLNRDGEIVLINIRKTILLSSLLSYNLYEYFIKLGEPEIQ